MLLFDVSETGSFRCKAWLLYGLLFMTCRW